MSIYPRSVKRGGNVTIHVRLCNESYEVIRPRVILRIARPNKMISVLFDRRVAISPYYETTKQFKYRVRKKDPLGKYRVSLAMYIEKQEIASKTRERDFFEVVA